MSKNKPAPAKPVFANSPFEGIRDRLARFDRELGQDIEKEYPVKKPEHRPAEEDLDPSIGQLVLLAKDGIEGVSNDYQNMLVAICNGCAELQNTLQAIKGNFKDR